MLAWIFFRASNVATAKRMLAALFGLNGLEWHCSFNVVAAVIALGLVWIVVWFLPNTQEWLAKFNPALGYEATTSPRKFPAFISRLAWQPSVLWALALATVAVFTLSQMSRVSEFIYWQF